MKSYSISVVIPTYNRPNYLGKAIDSAINQSHPPIEIIVVDDGSKTNYAEQIVSTYNDKTIRLISHLQPKGGNAARNTGIAAAQGDLIAFLDDDDYWHSQKLEKQIPYFEDPSVGAVYCGTLLVDNHGNLIRQLKKRSYPVGWLLNDLLIKDKTSSTPTYIVRKEVFLEVGGFDETLPARQDWDMSIRIASHYQIQAAAERLVFVHVHNGPRTSTGYEKIISAQAVIYKKYQLLRKSAGFLVMMKAGAAFCNSQGDGYRIGQISRIIAILYYLRGLLYCPWYKSIYFGLFKSILPINLLGILQRN